MSKGSSKLPNLCLDALNDYNYVASCIIIVLCLAFFMKDQKSLVRNRLQLNYYSELLSIKYFLSN